jgi:hypothetical protein
VPERYPIVTRQIASSAAGPSRPTAPSIMATRCDCRWERVDLHADLDTLMLRADAVPDCPAHSGVREDEDTAA